ncbi:cell envelope-related transcriptional attenuator [Bifidobacterium lemurum]|uniref:Cell envelope-related transcriptional attenuator n=1 Tax=Bifidobacterium lemurum TaxID=1603886 RepID=A0A261FTM2_9BIFI|nr:LCP family protein [Bifidobacterium lemurum]OZG62438.1 cell envelope-related transcriptional attenuator [Bifidobacterium lemurum]QOL35464.1 LCP family protein [Bifidobacterium lemurum]
MTQDAGGADPRSIPPSFVPSASRRQRSVSAGSAGAAQSGSAPVPPSFTPRASRGGQTPQSIPPAASRTRGANAAPRTSRASTSSGSAASAQRPAAAAVPESIAPRAARTSRASSAHVQPASRPTPSMAAAPGSGSMANVASAPRRRGPKATTIVATVLLLLVVAMALSVFGAWNWVDGRLNKTSWLTDAADTPASTWLILGSDERDGTTPDESDVQGFRTDTILVLTKPKSGASSLISIPRDSLVAVDDTYMKINAVAEIFGSQALVSEVEQITGQKIDHVAQIQFGGLTQVVDALGGIELCYDEDVSDPYSGLEWQAGCHTADGGTALAFSRMRYADATGDFGRNARQRQVISAIVSKASSRQTLTNPSTVMSVAQAGLDSITVDEDTNPYSMLMMALAFKSATGDEGVSGSVYWTDPDYYVDGVGSSVLLDDAKNLELFSQLADGTHAAGTVGTLAESQG